MLPRRRAVSAGLAALVAAVIFWGSASPRETMASIPGFQSWVAAAHVAAYAILALVMLSSALGTRTRWWPAGMLLCTTVFSLATLYGGLLELYQAGVPGRVPSWQDGLFNAVGAIVGVAAGYGGLGLARRLPGLGRERG